MDSVEPVRTRKKFQIYMNIDRDKVGPEFIDAYLQKNEVAVAGYINRKLVTFVQQGKVALAFPSLNFPPRLNGQPDDGNEQIGQGVPIEGLKRLVLSFASDDSDLLQMLRDELQNFAAFLAVGTDLMFDAVDRWCPGETQGHLFGDRTAANNLIAAGALADENLVGDNVNVVVIDRGLNKEDICNKLNGKFGGGWVNCPQGEPPCIHPGTLKFVRGVTDNDHGMMVARNVLGVAPAVILHDLPLIPARITSIPMFRRRATRYR